MDHCGTNIYTMHATTVGTALNTLHMKPLIAPTQHEAVPNEVKGRVRFHFGACAHWALSVLCHDHELEQRDGKREGWVKT